MINNPLPSHQNATSESRNAYSNISRFGIIDRSKCTNTLFPCCTKEKHHVFRLNGFEINDDPLLEINQVKSNCCTKSFEVKESSSGTLVESFDVKNKCICNFCFGPELISRDPSSRSSGHAIRPCQIANFGVNIMDSSISKRKAYIGSNLRNNKTQKQT